MNLILIGLGATLTKISSITDEIKKCPTAIELPNNCWFISSSDDLSWWNQFIFESVKAKYPNIYKAGSSDKAYFTAEVSSTNVICGLMDKGITAKLREFKKDNAVPAKEVVVIQNILDRMDVEEEKHE